MAEEILTIRQPKDLNGVNQEYREVRIANTNFSYSCISNHFLTKVSEITRNIRIPRSVALRMATPQKLELLCERDLEVHLEEPTKLEDGARKTPQFLETQKEFIEIQDPKNFRQAALKNTFIWIAGNIVPGSIKDDDPVKAKARFAVGPLEFAKQHYLNDLTIEEAAEELEMDTLPVQWKKDINPRSAEFNPEFAELIPIFQSIRTAEEWDKMFRAVVGTSRLSYEKRQDLASKWQRYINNFIEINEEEPPVQDNSPFCNEPAGKLVWELFQKQDPTLKRHIKWYQANGFKRRRGLDMQELISERFCTPDGIVKSYTEIGNMFGMSRERVRQIISDFQNTLLARENLTVPQPFTKPTKGTIYRVATPQPHKLQDFINE